MLECDIYGLKARIDFRSSEDERGIKELFEFFIHKDINNIDIDIKFNKRRLLLEIGGLLFPHLARRGLYAFHAGCIVLNDGVLIVGPSDSGKSTIVKAALRTGIPLLADDVVILSSREEGIVVRPFYSKILLDGEEVKIDESFRNGIQLDFIIFPVPVDNFTFYNRINSKIDIVRKLVPQILWSEDSHIQEDQKDFILKLGNYSAFDLYWSLEDRDNPSKIMEAIDAMVHCAR